MNSATLNRKMVRLGTAKPTIPNGRPAGSGTESQTIHGQEKRKGKPVESYKGWWPQKWPCTKNHGHENIGITKNGLKLYCSLCETEKRRERKRKKK